MMTAAVKRKRSPNWLPSEKQLLLDLVKKHPNVIENKKTDTQAMQLKHEEWKIITEEYNRRTTQFTRTGANLKVQWKSLKKAAKKELALHKKNLSETEIGGEPSEDKKFDHFHGQILSFLKKSCSSSNDSIDKDGGDTSESNLCSNSNEDVPNEIIYINTDQNDCQEDNDDSMLSLDTEHSMDSSETKASPTHDWSDPDPPPPSSAPHLLKTDLSKDHTNKTFTSRQRPKLYHKNPTYRQTLLIKNEVQKQLLNIEKSRRKSDLEIEIKREQLKQEKLKTRLLFLELKKKKKEILNN